MLATQIILTNVLYDRSHPEFLDCLYDTFLFENKKWAEHIEDLQKKYQVSNSKKEVEEIKATLIEDFESFFSRLGIKSNNPLLINDLAEKFLVTIKQKPISYDNDHSEGRKNKAILKIAKDIFSNKTICSRLRSCQILIIDQDDVVKTILIKKLLADLMTPLKIIYASVLSDKENFEAIENILKNSVIYQFSKENVIQAEKYSLFIEFMEPIILQQTKFEIQPKVVIQRRLNACKSILKNALPEPYTAIIIFEKATKDLQTFADKVEALFVKNPSFFYYILIGSIIFLSILSLIFNTPAVISIIFISGVLIGSGNYYLKSRIASKDDQERKNFLKSENLKNVVDSFEKALKFKRKISEKIEHSEIIYTNCENQLPRESMGNLLFNLLGTPAQSSYAYFAQEGIKIERNRNSSNNFEKTEKLAANLKAITQRDDQIITWLSGIIRSDMKEIKKCNLPDSKDRGIYSWVTWDSFNANFDEKFQASLEQKLINKTPGTYCLLKDLVSIRDVCFYLLKGNTKVKLEKDFHIKGAKFDNEIVAGGEHRFSSILIPADQSEGPQLRIVCTKIPHLINNKAKKQFANTTSSVEIILTSDMAKNYYAINSKEEKEEGNFFSSLAHSN